MTVTRTRARPQRLHVCVLGSGSGGNCTIVRFGQHAILIDLGFGPRTTARRMAQASASLDDICAVCVTHFDTDHFRRVWPGKLAETGVPLFTHRWHSGDLCRIEGGHDLVAAGLVRLFDDQPFEPAPGMTAYPVRLQHDRQGTIGYRIDTPGGSLGYATDLGHAPPRLIDLLVGVDILCIESNYDERMTINSPRPTFVNRRNMSDSGHLSNEQSLEAVQQIARRSPPGLPRHVVLMHRSRQCNHPRKVQRVFERDPTFRGRIILTDQRRRTRWLTAPRTTELHRRQLRWGF